jgi:TrmH family RNA methyltransferase
MGALARVRIHYVDLPQWLESQITNHKSKINIYGTLLDGRNMYEEQSLTTNDQRPTTNIIVMGNEGNGISPAVRRLITHPLFIPSYPPGEPISESLNVAIATAIVLAEFRRPR